MGVVLLGDHIPAEEQEVAVQEGNLLVLLQSRVPDTPDTELAERTGRYIAPTGLHYWRPSQLRLSWQPKPLKQPLLPFSAV